MSWMADHAVALRFRGRRDKTPCGVPKDPHTPAPTSSTSQPLRRRLSSGGDLPRRSRIIKIIEGEQEKQAFGACKAPQLISPSLTQTSDLIHADAEGFCH